MTDQLTGLFFIKNNDTTFNTGRVICKVDESNYLLSFEDIERPTIPLPMEVMHIDDMGLTLEGDARLQFFTTKDDMWTFINSASTPLKPVVMALVPKEPK